MKYLFFIILFSKTVIANDFFYLKNISSCQIKALRDGKLVSIINKKDLENTPLELTQLEEWPNFVTFELNEQKYVTSTECVYLNNDSNSGLLNRNNRNKKIPKIELEKTVEELAGDNNNYYFEFGGGMLNISDQSQVPEDYNTLLPSDPINPIEWGKASESPYKTKFLFNIAFGIKAFQDGYWAFKIRTFKGSKTDSLTLTNLNHGTTENGEWTYSDSLNTYYAGFKYLFTYNSDWKPTIAGYIGLNSGSTILTDGATTYNFSSSGISAILEGGIDYILRSDLIISSNLNYEYIGQRVLSPDNNDGSVATEKTKLNYSNLSATIGIKTYF